MFVGGLSWETTQESLQRYFGQYGEVIDCVVMKNSETGRSRGFGFVTFADPNKVDSVLKSGPHELDGRTVRLRKVKTTVIWQLYFFVENCKLTGVLVLIIKPAKG